MKKKVGVLSVILLISVCLLLFYVVLEKSDLGLLGNKDAESSEASDTPSPSTTDQAENDESDSVPLTLVHQILMYPEIARTKLWQIMKT
jgi:hypothetical protein